MGGEGFPLCKVVELVWNPQPMGLFCPVTTLGPLQTCDQVGYMEWEKDTHRRCVQRTLEVFKIPHHHHHFFQIRAAGPAGWMVFRYPELLRVNPTLSQPVAGRLVLTQQPPV